LGSQGENVHGFSGGFWAGEQRHWEEM
jgi:hypothetical protein